MTKAFDTIAKSYDVDFSNTGIGMAQRKQVWQQLTPLLSSTKNVLEISCGTGVDAIYIAPKVHSILATDISDAMLHETQQKIEKHNLKNCSVACVDAAQLEVVRSKEFDLLFSNFGGLNCLDPISLTNFAAEAYKILKPGASLCLVFIAKKCVWERLYFTLRHSNQRGRRLRSGGSPTTIGNEQFLTHYYSVQELKTIFKQFTLVKANAIGLFVPPGFLEKKIPKALLKLFQAFDFFFSKFKVLANYGDHVLVVFQKN